MPLRGGIPSRVFKSTTPNPKGTEMLFVAMLLAVFGTMHVFGMERTGQSGWIKRARTCRGITTNDRKEMAR